MATPIRFETEEAAQSALKRAGFSLGRLQRDEPRGVLFGDYDIAKWRNLSAGQRGQLHGIYQRLFRGLGGPVEIALSRNCPAEPRQRLMALSSQAKAKTE